VAGIALAACRPARSAPAPSPPPPSVGARLDATIGLRRDPALAALLDEISPARLRAIDSSLVGFGTRHTMSDTLSPSRGIGAARRWIHAELSRYAAACRGCLHVEYDPAPVVVERHPDKPTVNVVNVLAWLPGRDTTRVVVIQGHYDSCICSVDPFDATADAPGADDDGSGTAAVMELAHAFARRFPGGLDATVLFALVAGEEQGLLGSTHLAGRLHAQGYRVVAAMTDDIVGNVVADDGRVDSTSVRVFAPGFPVETRDGRLRVNTEMDASPSRELGRYAWAAGAVYLPDTRVVPVWRLDRVGRGGDHAPFWRAGDPALRFTERLENYKRQHLPTDRLADVSFGYVARVARLNAAVVGALAAAPAAPDSVAARRDRPSGGQKWMVSWAAVAGATSYEVLVRATTAPTHEVVHDAGAGTSWLLDAQLDDASVAVRAVGANGHRSLATAVAGFGVVSR
jgi:hypothetical protein